MQVSSGSVKARGKAASVALVATAVVLGAPMHPRAVRAEDTAVEELAGVLFEKGLIDDAQRAQILAKDATDRARSDASGVTASALSGWEVSRDLRIRSESTYFDSDALGNEATTLPRFRYRAHIAAKRKLNDMIPIGLRLASGGTDPRSTNQSFGAGADFDRDPIQSDQAFVKLCLPETGFGMKSSVDME
jgi:hypothetical protein